jgi:hypothetical protein
VAVPGVEVRGVEVRGVDGAILAVGAAAAADVPDDPGAGVGVGVGVEVTGTRPGSAVGLVWDVPEHAATTTRQTRPANSTVIRRITGSPRR